MSKLAFIVTNEVKKIIPSYHYNIQIVHNTNRITVLIIYVHLSRAIKTNPTSFVSYMHRSTIELTSS